MMKFLNNPLETFKSFVYDFDIVHLSTPLKESLIDQTSFDHDSFYNTESLLSIVFGTSSLFFVLILIFYSKMINNWSSILLTFACVILTQILFYPFAIQTFVNTIITSNTVEILNEVDDMAQISPNVEIYTDVSHFALVSVLFLKESISFFSLFALWWILANYSFSDTLLMPKTIIEVLDELIYRKNLALFADTLQIKHHHEVRNFQEFFIKVHGILLFILIANVQGMVPYSSTITSSLVNTFYISLAVFINIIITILREKGFSHFFSLFLPQGCPFNLIFLLNPIEFISYVFRLVSLSVRLFANMMAGHTLMKVIAGFSWSLILLGDHYVIIHYLPFFVLFILTFLEIAVGFIQTYIFVILVYIYLSDIFAGH